jgi:hypothetical protein
MAEQVYLAIDLGAESGRVMAGMFDGQHIRLEELHRFSNGPVNVADTMRGVLISFCCRKPVRCSVSRTTIVIRERMV